MGWRGTLRTVAAASRQMEREAARRHKQAVKEQMSADAAQDVENWEDYIAGLVSIHTKLTAPMDWDKVLSKPAPSKPVRKSDHENSAREALDGFKPRLLDKVFGGSAKRKADLEHTLAEAPGIDDRTYKAAEAQYAKDLKEWEEDRSLAARLMKGEGAAIREVISEVQPLVKEDLIGSHLNFSFDDDYIHARPLVHSNEIVPSIRRKQLASGKLSETKMPVGEFNELYQDYVASVALKVAGDLFRILPLDQIYVTCEAEMLNTATGHQEPTPILSVQFVRATMEKLNLEAVDPSDSMSNFNHRMAWSRTKGFSAIEPLTDK